MDAEVPFVSVRDAACGRAVVPARLRQRGESVVCNLRRNVGGVGSAKNDHKDSAMGF